MYQSDIDFLHLRAFLALFGPWAVFGQQQPKELAAQISHQNSWSFLRCYAKNGRPAILKKTTIARKYKNENTFRDQCRRLAPNGVRRA